MTLETKEEIKILINKRLDFKRNSDVGYLLTDYDIIASVIIEINIPVTYDEIENILNEVRKGL